MMQAIYDSTVPGMISLKGYKCKRGIKFGQDEILNPLRILTTTIGIDSKGQARLAVRSNIPVPKDMIFKMVKEAKKHKTKPPVKMDDIIIENILGTGVNIISSSSVGQ